MCGGCGYFCVRVLVRVNVYRYVNVNNVTVPKFIFDFWLYGCVCVCAILCIILSALMLSRRFYILFLGATKHLYNWLCPSVGWLVGWLVGR